jgi:succinate dehydrogenase / fumarate reductase membrane anchor subunit
LNTKRSGLGWLGQAISGIALLALLGLHWIAQHYLVAGGLRNYSEMVAYLGHPLVLALELAFLVVVTYHALMGVRAILLDIGPGTRFARLLDIGLVLVGIATVLYGIDLLRAILTS